MRHALKELNGVRRRFTGTFVRFGEKVGWKGKTLTTILLKNIRDANNRLLCDHLWFNLTKEFDSLILKEDMIVAFDARVKPYYKGYQGYREDVDKPVERDFRLANPTNVQVRVSRMTPINRASFQQECLMAVFSNSIGYTSFKIMQEHIDRYGIRQCTSINDWA